MVAGVRLFSGTRMSIKQVNQMPENGKVPMSSSMACGSWIITCSSYTCAVDSSLLSFLSPPRDDLGGIDASLVRFPPTHTSQPSICPLSPLLPTVSSFGDPFGVIESGIFASYASYFPHLLL